MRNTVCGRYSYQDSKLQFPDQCFTWANVHPGPVVRVGPQEVSISDPLAVREIHKIGNKLRKTGWYRNFANAASPSLFSMVNPEEHAARRKLLSQEFSKSAIIKRETMVKQKIELCVSKIRRDAIAGRADILMWFTYMATDIIGQLSFGNSFEMLEKEKVCTLPCIIQSEFQIRLTRLATP